MKLFYSILIFLPVFLFAQQPKTFTIIGHSDFYNNKNLFVQGGIFPASYGYNDFNFVNGKVDSLDNSYRSVQLQHNQFTTTGIQKYPHPFAVSYYDAEINRGSSSNIFFIDEDTVNIELADLLKDRNVGNLLNSKSNKEYFYLRKLCGNSINAITGETFDMPTKQKTLKKYIAQNPNSYVALWEMVLDYQVIRNNNDKKTTLNNSQFFSAKIKKTKTYLALVDNIKHDLELNVGKIFPNIPLNKSDSLFKIISKNKFTLVDFWFSGCAPCIAQFPFYKKIYSTFKENSFEIIGISVDRKEDQANWKKVIQKFDLDWLQYLDTNGKETDKLFIRKFPTNFLLDSAGKIIKMDISEEDLKTFLETNLN